MCELSISLLFRACLLFWVLCKGNYYLFTRFKINKYYLPMLLITASGIILNILWIHVFAWERQVVLRLKPFRERKEEILTCRSYLPDDVAIAVRKEKKTRFKIKKYNLPMLLITASGIILKILWIYVFAWERQVVLRLKPLGEKKKKYWLGDITYLKIILWNVRKEKKHTHQLK